MRLGSKIWAEMIVIDNCGNCNRRGQIELWHDMAEAGPNITGDGEGYTHDTRMITSSKSTERLNIKQ